MSSQNRVAGFNECPHPDCNTRKRRDLYACLKHWRELPFEIKSKINHGYSHSALIWNQGHEAAKAFWNGREGL